MENDDAVQYLWSLHKVNKALLDGLRTSVFVMKTWDELSDEKRQSMITMVNGLIEYGEKAFENVTELH